MIGGFRQAAACPACGRPARPGDSFCIHCGAAVGAAPAPARTPASAETPPPAEAGPARRRAGVAAFLSANLPGLGQVYNGQVARGLVSMALAAALLVIGIGLPFRALADGPDRWRFLAFGLLSLAGLALHVAASARQAWRYARDHPVRDSPVDGAAAVVTAIIIVELAALVGVNGVFLYLARA